MFAIIKYIIFAPVDVLNNLRVRYQTAQKERNLKTHETQELLDHIEKQKRLIAELRGHKTAKEEMIGSLVTRTENSSIQKNLLENNSLLLQNEIASLKEEVSHLKQDLKNKEQDHDDALKDFKDSLQGKTDLIKAMTKSLHLTKTQLVQKKLQLSKKLTDFSSEKEVTSIDGSPHDVQINTLKTRFEALVKADIDLNENINKNTKELCAMAYKIANTNHSLKELQGVINTLEINKRCYEDKIESLLQQQIKPLPL